MNVLQMDPDYIRDERDFLTPVSLFERLRWVLTPQTLVPQAFPLNWLPAIDISGIGQTKDIAKAFPTLYAAGWKLVIIRASYGLVKDALFDYFWRAAYDANMYIITYHFGYTGYTGASQASVYLKAIDPMLTEVDDHSAAVLDVEAPGDVAVWRKVVTDFHTNVKSRLICGDYSSVSKWKSCTNNMPVPSFAYNASWSSLTNVPSFAPAAQTVLRQVGVHLKHDWVPKPPGVNEDVDVDYFMGTEPELRKFLGYDDTPQPPPPPPSNTEVRLSALETWRTTVDTSILELQRKDTLRTTAILEILMRLDKLETSNLLGDMKPVPFALKERKPAYYYRNGNKSTKPVFEFYPNETAPTSERKYFSGTVQVLPLPIAGDSGKVGYIVVEPDLLPGTLLFVMADDRAE